MHSARNRQTYTIPLAPGQHVPALPHSGLTTITEAAQLPGAETIAERAYVGGNRSIYAFPRVTTHRNIYRITVR